MLVTISTLFGLIVGSFLNVLILREGETPLTGRSKCPACKSPIKWYDLVPLLSWILLRGRCRTCGARISLQYPLVEGGTAFLFLVIALAPISLTLKMLALPIAALLLAIAVYDFRTTYIPDTWVWTLNGLALLTLLLPPYPILHTPYVAFSGPIAALPLFLLWAVSRGRWMGFGDVKLSLAIGWLLGSYAGFISVWLAFILGAFVALPLFVLSSPWVQHITHTRGWGTSYKTYTMKSELPFGPFLVASCFLVWFAQLYGFDAISLLYFF